MIYILYIICMIYNIYHIYYATILDPCTFKNASLLFWVCVCMCWYVCAHALAWVLRSENSLLELVLSCYVGSGAPTQFVSLVSFAFASGAIHLQAPVPLLKS